MDIIRVCPFSFRKLFGIPYLFTALDFQFSDNWNFLFMRPSQNNQNYWTTCCNDMTTILFGTVEYILTKFEVWVRKLFLIISEHDNVITFTCPNIHTQIGIYGFIPEVLNANLALLLINWIKWHRCNSNFICVSVFLSHAGIT